MSKIFGYIKKIEPLYQGVYNIFLFLCKMLLILDILITCWIVLARYMTAIPAPNWGEEIILTLMAYMAVLSATLAIKKNAHIRMTAFDNYLPKKLGFFLDLVSDIGLFILALVMIIIGWNYRSHLRTIWFGNYHVFRRIWFLLRSIDCNGICSPAPVSGKILRK